MNFNSSLLQTTIVFYLFSCCVCSWDNWWTYDGISGPDFWGLLNPKWSHCSKGRKQSPVDIDTNRLLFDPGLKPFDLIGEEVEGHLENTGRGIRFNVNFNSSSTLRLRGGPLSYEYQLSHLVLHFGRENDRGSEHSINGQRFPGELQAYFFNSILYENYTEAEHQPNGLAALAVLLQITEQEEIDNEINGQVGNHRPAVRKITSSSQASSNSLASPDLNQLLAQMEQIKHKGSRSQGQWRLNLRRLLPGGQFYLTYEGSLTIPPCTETTVWLLLNRPLRLAARQLHTLRHSVVIDGYGDNYRPSQSLAGRCVRTNIVNRATLTNNSLAAEKLMELAGLSTNTNLDQTEQAMNNKVLQRNRSTFIDGDDATNAIDSTTVKSFCTTGNRIGFYTYKANVKR